MSRQSCCFLYFFSYSFVNTKYIFATELCRMILVIMCKSVVSKKKRCRNKRKHGWWWEEDAMCSNSLVVGGGETHRKREREKEAANAREREQASNACFLSLSLLHEKIKEDTHRGKRVRRREQERHDEKAKRFFRLLINRNHKKAQHATRVHSSLRPFVRPSPSCLLLSLDTHTIHTFSKARKNFLFFQLFVYWTEQRSPCCKKEKMQWRVHAVFYFHLYVFDASSLHSSSHCRHSMCYTLAARKRKMITTTTDWVLSTLLLLLLLLTVISERVEIILLTIIDGGKDFDISRKGIIIWLYFILRLFL